MNRFLVYVVLVASVVLSCSKDRTSGLYVPKIIKLNKVIPEKANIGDTIVLQGENLDKIMNLKFNDEWLNVKILSKSSTEISVIVPNLHNENVTIYALAGEQQPGSPVDQISFNLVGYFSFFRPSSGVISHLIPVDEKTFFGIIGESLYKTSDGGYNWVLINNLHSYVNSIFFLDETTGWVSVNSDGICNLLFTKDGGKSFQNLFRSNNRYDGRYIMDMHFLSNSEGYLLSGKGEIYNTSDNLNFRMVYQYPLSDTGSGALEFFSISVYNNSLLARGLYALISGKAGTFRYSTLSGELAGVQLVNENEAYIIKGNNLFFTGDSGTSFTKLSDIYFRKFHFTDKNVGFGIFQDISHDRHFVLQTFDGGYTWVNSSELFSSVADMAFVRNVGLISCNGGLIWKYIKE